MKETHALKISSLIFLFALSIFTGCQQTRHPGAAVNNTYIDTPADIITYLRKQNLPALKKVQTWQNIHGPGIKITTRHYEIFTTLFDPLVLSEIPAFMESAYRAYNRQLPKPVETTRPFTVYIFDHRKQWEDFTQTFAGSQAWIYCKTLTGAYYLNGACVTYNIGRERMLSVLGHEGWHQFNSRLFKYRLPSWLNEGVAMLFETSRIKNGMFTFEAAKNIHRLGSLKITLSQNNMIPLKQLIALNPGQVLASGQNKPVTAFYSQAYALVRFLREDNYGKRLTNFQQMLLDAVEGKWPISNKNRIIAADRNIPLTVGWNSSVGIELFEKYISYDFSSLEKEYKAFCRKITYRVRVKIPK